MTATLSMGANTALDSPVGELVVTHPVSASVDVNLTAFLVGADGKVRSDADMVFFNQPGGDGGSATWQPPQEAAGSVRHRLAFDLTKLPAGIEKIVIALTEDRGAGFAAVPGLAAHVAAGGAPVVELSPVPPFTTEQGLIVGEVYVRRGGHKLRAVWQGYAAGLAALATDHGVEVDDEPAPPAPAPAAVETTKAAPTPTPTTPTPVATPGGVSFQKVTGKVGMKKGDQPVLMEKTPKITAKVSWQSGTDYDVYALVWSQSEGQVDVAMFEAEGVKPRQSFKGVRHTGDVKKGSGKVAQTETIEIVLDPDILAVVPVAYSAQANGVGSFHKYRVSLSIDNGAGTEITLDSADAHKSRMVFTCVPGIIRNLPEGVQIEPLELYSKRMSEKRPKLIEEKGQIAVKMDAGPVNKFKK